MHKILIVEDEEAIRLGLADLLEIEGFTVDSAVDGEEAMEKVRKFQPHLVILDLMLPKASGYDVTRYIRKSYPQTFILMLTAKNEEINKIQGLFPIAIYELNGDNRTMLAVSWWKGKTVALLPPGKHVLFATPGGLGHIMEANVEAGKRYYVLLRFIYANGFQMRPLRTSGDSEYRTTSPDFAKWIKETRWVEKTADAEAFFAAERIQAAMNTGQQNALNNWQAKTAAEAAELTLNPADATTE